MKLFSSIEDLKEYCLNNSSPENDFEAQAMERYRFSGHANLHTANPHRAYYRCLKTRLS